MSDKLYMNLAYMHNAASTTTHCESRMSKILYENNCTIYKCGGICLKQTIKLIDLYTKFESESNRCRW